MKSFLDKKVKIFKECFDKKIFLITIIIMKSIREIKTVYKKKEVCLKRDGTPRKPYTRVIKRPIKGYSINVAITERHKEIIEFLAEKSSIKPTEIVRLILSKFFLDNGLKLE